MTVHVRHRAQPHEGRVLTLPNVLSALRLIGSPLVVLLAHLGNEPWLIALLAVLLFTDWIDGKLAVWLDQATPVGAILDTVADVSLYSAIGVSLLLVRPEQLEATWPWIAAAALSYLISTVASLIKFGRVASYHTLGAKTGWGLISAGTLAVLLFSWSWPFIVVGAWATAVNLEALAITATLDSWTPDVRGIRDVLRKAPRERPSPDD